MKSIILFSILLFTGIVNAQGPVTEKDRDFIKDATDCAMLEIKLGELAQSKASSIEVKNLANKIVSDHTTSNNELKEIAMRKEATVPTELSDESKKNYDMIANLEGNDFDKAYIKSTTKAHKKAICKFKKEVKKGDDGEIVTWANNTLTVLKNHKEASEETCKALKNKK